MGQFEFKKLRLLWQLQFWINGGEAFYVIGVVAVQIFVKFTVGELVPDILRLFKKDANILIPRRKKV